VNGWYVLHADGTPAGRFGSWRTGDEHAWTLKQPQRMSAAERAQQAADIAAARRAREAERTARQGTAAIRARRMWNSAPAASALHPYLRAKGVGAHGIRQLGSLLLIPLRDTAGDLWNLQLIGVGGGKKNLYGGRCAGLFHLLGTETAVAAGVLCIAEGYATAAAIHEATGHPVAVAFSAGNLATVALALRARHPAARIVLCADDDAATAAKTGRNPGVAAACAAAAAVGGLVAYPPVEEAPGGRGEVHA
jgi:putative DNA primase/helicase